MCRLGTARRRRRRASRKDFAPGRVPLSLTRTDSLAGSRPDLLPTPPRPAQSPGIPERPGLQTSLRLRRLLRAKAPEGTREVIEQRDGLLSVNDVQDAPGARGLRPHDPGETAPCPLTQEGLKPGRIEENHGRELYNNREAVHRGIERRVQRRALAHIDVTFHHDHADAVPDIPRDREICTHRLEPPCALWCWRRV